jgi:membrane-bound serine protease (ClpP class)
MVLEEQTLGSSGPVLDLEKHVGRTGITRSALRPSGVAHIDGSRLDVMATEGTWIDAGEPVVVVGVQTNSLLVERVSTGEDKGATDV